MNHYNPGKHADFHIVTIAPTILIDILVFDTQYIGAN